MKVNMKIYVVGGAVRDFLNNAIPRDTDYVVVGSSKEEMLAQGFTQVGADFPVFLHPVTNDEYALARIERKTGQGYAGFATETDSVTLEEDLSRRDLTINAMAMDADFNITDPHSGQKDLESKVLRHVSPAFSEDPLRVLRVARFKARFGPGWSIAPETQDLMLKMVSDGALDELSGERVWAEIEKGLNEPHPGLMLEVLRALRVLNRPAFSDYSGALLADLMPLQLSTACQEHVAVRFALAFPRQWKAEELKDSRVPKSIREVSHCLDLGLNNGLRVFNTLGPAQKVAALEILDAFRQSGRMGHVIKALEYLHPEQTPPILDALSGIGGINQVLVLEGITAGAAIKAAILQARIDAVAELT